MRQEPARVRAWRPTRPLRTRAPCSRATWMAARQHEHVLAVPHARARAGRRQDQRPAGRDLAGDVAARDVRHWHRDVRHSLPLPDVEAIQCAGTDADDRFARRGPRVRHIFEREHLGSAMFMEADGLHGAQNASGGRTTGSPKPSVPSVDAVASRSPTMSVVRRSGWTCRSITRCTSAAVTRAIVGTNCSK